MFHRTLTPLSSNSFFIFGARGTGKTTWLKAQELYKDCLWFDFLDQELEDTYQRDPAQFSKKVLGTTPKPHWIILDEIQRVPRLLNSVHSLIESHALNFVLTGSSARKLKRGAANLLAGRAFVHHMHPLTSLELDAEFDLLQTLNFGSLPKIFSLQSVAEKEAYLKSYALTYIKEEIQMEQAVRKLEPFRNFLEIAALMNGQTLNFSKIAKEAGCNTKTIQSYYEVLQDTWLGFYVPAYHRSIRKSQRLQPKFYLFDPGIKRALERSLASPLTPGTSAFGNAFEHWVVLECYRLNDYFGLDYKISYYQTHQGAEVDLVLSLPGKDPILIEIKSTSRVDSTEVNKLARISKDLMAQKSYYWSQCPNRFEENSVTCCFWREGLQEVFKPR